LKSEKILYFAYGANLDLRGMELRCPGYKPISRAVLKNYRLVFRGVADITPDLHYKVDGALYELTHEHLRVLDRFEGYPHLYTRKLLPVIIEQGEEVKAIVYIMVDRKTFVAPYRSYLNVILSGCQQWQLPKEHLNYIIVKANDPTFGEQ